jgi:hypothetical protein
LRYLRMHDTMQTNQIKKVKTILPSRAAASGRNDQDMR